MLPATRTAFIHNSSAECEGFNSHIWDDLMIYTGLLAVTGFKSAFELVLKTLHWEAECMSVVRWSNRCKTMSMWHGPFKACCLSEIHQHRVQHRCQFMRSRKQRYSTPWFLHECLSTSFWPELGWAPYNGSYIVCASFDLTRSALITEGYGLPRMGCNTHHASGSITQVL